MSGRDSQRPSGAPPTGTDEDADPSRAARAERDEYDDPLDPVDAHHAQHTQRRSTRPPRDHDYDDRPSLDRILPELLRRGLEAGRGPLGRVGESFGAKEIAQSIVAQLGDARSGVVKAVALEVGHFLREADIASEMRKVLVGLDVEASVKLRFNEREDGTLEPEVELQSGNASRSESAGRPAARAGAKTDTKP